jgi:hypothetical protein
MSIVQNLVKTRVKFLWFVFASNKIIHKIHDLFHLEVQCVVLCCPNS